jgi:hypothetical protein
MLNELLNFRENEQRIFLERVWEWVQSNKKFVSVPKSTIARPIQDDSTDTTRDQDTSVYSLGNRTWHKGIDPTQERLERFQHRQIIGNLSNLKKNYRTAPGTFPNFYPKA